MFSDSLRETFKYGISSDRVNGKTLKQFDVSSFLIKTGSVFDPCDRSKARRETLILAASWLFNQKGIDATSLDEIASKVGVTKKVIYHNIGGKDVLVAECYRRAFRFFSFIADCAKEYNGNRLDAVCTTLLTLSATSLRQDIAPLVPISVHDAWSEQDGEDLHVLVEGLIKHVAKLFQSGIDEGSIRSLNVHTLLMLRPGFYEWMPRWGSSLSDAELAQAPAELSRLYRLGLAPLDS